MPRNQPTTTMLFVAAIEREKGSFQWNLTENPFGFVKFSTERLATELVVHVTRLDAPTKS